MSTGTLGGPKPANAQTVGQVITHPTYMKACSSIRPFITRSRQGRDDPQALLTLQAEMVGELLAFESSQRRMERRATDSSSSAPSRNQARVGVAAMRRLSCLVREIGDGIAWRLLDYDRAWLYQLALKPHTGHLDPMTVNNELEAAQRHATSGTPVLLNDLTNFIKYGDLTLRLDEAIRLVEVKSGKGSGRSGRATRQWQKLASVASFLNTKVRETATGNERLVRLTTEPKTHLPAVQELIKDARRKGNAHARLSDCLAVDVYHVEAAAALSAARQSLFLTRHNPFEQSSKSAASDSLGLFYHFTPNRAPYSVFPWPDDVCADLLVGNLRIITYFNWDKIERRLKRRGLVVQDLARERLDQFRSLPFQEQKRRGFDVGLRVSRVNSSPCTVSLAELSRIVNEFLDEESFADSVEEILDIGIPVGDQFFTAFQHEAQIWN